MEVWIAFGVGAAVGLLCGASVAFYVVALASVAGRRVPVGPMEVTRAEWDARLKELADAEYDNLKAVADRAYNAGLRNASLSPEQIAHVEGKDGWTRKERSA